MDGELPRGGKAGLSPTDAGDGCRRVSAVELAAGESRSFNNTDLPRLDVAAPDFSTAFPTVLDSTADASGFRMTALIVWPVPVPAALPLMLSGTGLPAWRRRRA